MGQFGRFRVNIGWQYYFYHWVAILPMVEFDKVRFNIKWHCYFKTGWLFTYVRVWQV